MRGIKDRQSRASFCSHADAASIDAGTTARQDAGLGAHGGVLAMAGAAGAW
jgi:hypothetical protein